MSNALPSSVLVIGKAVSIGAHALQIAGFVEKPTEAIAESNVSPKQYLWSGGFFVMKASLWRKVTVCLPRRIRKACHVAVNKRQCGHDFRRIDTPEFAVCPPEAIDNAVIEKLAGSPELGIPGNVIPMSAGWSEEVACDALVGGLVLKNSYSKGVRSDVLVTRRDATREVRNIVARSEEWHRSQFVSTVKFTDLGVATGPRSCRKTIDLANGNPLSFGKLR